MITVDRVTFNSYSGPRIKGVSSFSLAPNPGHWEKVLWLTSKVESGGRFGAITMYDGTAVTAGLHQAIAVYPKELADEDFNAADDQGSLFQLLRMLQLVPDFPEVQELMDLFKTSGWVLNRDGSLRYLNAGQTNVHGQLKTVKAGDLVYGFEIRENFTPHQGAVPAAGPAWETSKKWALAFQKIFAHPKSFHTQVEFGAQHFESVARNKKITAKGNTQSIESWLYDGHIADFKPTTPALDLALAVFWSHSVNGPAIAYQLLDQALEAVLPGEDPDKFARILLRLLGRKQYGRWHFSEPDGRWQRTRDDAKEIWPANLFAPDGVMPTTL